MTDISSQTLHIVAKELTATLNEARAALEAYAERPHQTASLERCADHLHLAYGVLRLVEVHGAALLAEEMEQVTRYLLLAGIDQKRQLEGLDALMRAMVQLPTYLERVLSGGRDLALVLLPLLNDLRSVRGNQLLSEGTLLLLNLKSDQPAQPRAAHGEPEMTVAEWARRLRSRFQLGLLGYIRGESPLQNLEILSQVAEKLEQVATTQPVFQLWWVVGALLEAMRENGLEGSATLKRLLGQTDRQIKALYELGEARYCEDPPIDLLNNLLYYIARSATAGGRVAAVRTSFRLTELLPVDDSIEQERESLSAPSVKLMRTVAAAIKEDLSRVKDVFDIFVRRGGGRSDELVPQLDLLKKISDTLGVLGLGELRQRVQHEVLGISEIIVHGNIPSQAQLIKVAGVLLSVEDNLDDQLLRLILPTLSATADVPADQDNEFRLVTEAVLRECIVNLARIKEAVSVAVHRSSDFLPQGLDSVPQLLRGITAGLLMLGKGRAVSLMDAIGIEVRKLIEPGAPAPGAQRLERIADAIVSIEYYMETLQNGRADPWYMLDNAEACIKALAEQGLPRVPRIDSSILSDTAETVQVHPEPTMAMEWISDAEVATEPAISAAPSPAVEPQFVELFIEEAKEEIASIQQSFPRWDQNPVDLDALKVLRRSFHTLKGSGRMVGTRLIAEFGWSIENLLNRLLDKTLTRTPGLMALLRTAVAALPKLVEQLEYGRPNLVPATEIMARAFDYAEGREAKDAGVSQEAKALEDGVPPSAPEFGSPEPAQEPVSAPAESKIESVAEPSIEAPAELKIEAPAEAKIAAPAEAKIAAPAESKIEAPTKPPTEAPADAMAEGSHEVPIDAPARTTDGAPIDALTGVPGGAPIEAPAGAPSEAPTGVPSEAPIERLAGAPSEAPTGAPARAPVEAVGTLPGEAPMQVPAGVPGEAPMEAPTQASVEAPTRASVEAVRAVPSEALMQAPAGAPSAAPMEAPTQASVDAVRAVPSEAPMQAAAGVLDESPMEALAEPPSVASMQAPAGAPSAAPTGVPAGGPGEALMEAPAETTIDAGTPARLPAVAAGPPTPMDPLLHDIYSKETSSHVAEIREFLSKRYGSPAPHYLPESVYRAIHTLSGSSKMAEARHGIRITEPLNDVMRKFYDNGQGLSDHGLATLADAVRAIEDVVAHINESSGFFVDQPALLQGLHALEAELDVELAPTSSDDAGAAAGAAAIVPQLGEDALSSEPAAPERAGEAFDHDIANIYSEEATELLEAAERSLTAWNRNRKGKDGVADLQRHLHTLKGGARMAGIGAMSKLSHELETLVINIDSGMLRADDAAYAVMQASLDELARMRDVVSKGSLPEAAGTLLAEILGLSQRLAVPAGAAAAPEELREAASEAMPRASADSPAEPDDSVPGLETSAGPTLPGRDNAPSERVEMARVDAELLDTMLNNAGEVSIFRARLDQQVNSIDFNLAELARTVTRLKEQLRGLEMETEAQVLNRHRDEDSRRTDFDPLELDRYSALQQFSRALVETSGDVGSIQGLLETLTREAQNLLTQQARVITELQNSLMRTRMVPFQRHVQRLTRLVRQVANDTGNRAELVVQGASAELDRQMLERMVAPLEHMLRNAVAHGIETPERRAALGKPEVGRISVTLTRDGAEVVVVVADDGGGIDVKLIREKAASLGLVDRHAKLTDEEAMQLILEPGFSTAGHVTQSAGRGVGMDVVTTEIKKLGGGLFIESTAGKGSRFTIRLPFTLAISQALIVRVSDEVYALPLATVEGVVRLPRNIVARHLGKEAPPFEYGGQKYRFQQLGVFVGVRPSRLPESDVSMSVVLIRAGEHSTALVTDELVGSREIVVKSLGPQISAIRGIAGATILGDGRVVVILDMGSLVRSEWRSKPSETPALEQRDRRTFALVVDDSITVRRVTQRLLERNGMRVLTAKDGVDAVSLLQDNLPDIILLDIEMPRMDGYEVAAHVRNDARLKNIPIVMITSRVSEKHRARAIELGVDDYLGKPYQESQLLDAIEPLVHRRSAVAG